MKLFIISDPSKETMGNFINMQEDRTPKLDLIQHFG